MWPETETTTRAELRSIVIGWSGPGTLIGRAADWSCGSMASPFSGSGCVRLTGRLPAIDEENLSGRERRLAGGEKHDRIGDLVGVADALERDGPDEAGL